jgi:hypothetical protein
MKISMTIDKAGLDAKMLALKAIEQKIPIAISRAAQYTEGLILARTAKGDGVDGKFEQYSTGYADAKRDGWAGTRSRQGFGGDASGIVNLMVHGTMLAAMQTSAEGNTARIHFGRATEARKAAFNHAQRPFFAVNNKERDQIVAFFNKQLRK